MTFDLNSAKSAVSGTKSKLDDLTRAGKALPLDAQKFNRDNIAKDIGNFDAATANKLTQLSNSVNPNIPLLDKDNPTSTTNGKNVIKQTERLLTVRPRSSAFSDAQAGDRGTRARIRLVTTDLEKSRQARATSGLVGTAGDSDIASVFSKLTDTNPGAGYSDFLLTSVSVSFNEKVQITPTFGDTETVYYFGKQPVIFNLSGLLIDDIDNQWFNTFVETYGAIMRGSESARNFELIEMILPNMIITGTIMSMSYNQDASRDTDIPFTMTMHAKTAVPIPVRLPTSLPNNAAKLINWNKAQNFTSFADINKVKATSNDFIGDLPLADEVQPMAIVNNVTKNGARLPHGAPTEKTTSVGIFGSSIFSPVFGVLTSITKVVKDVTGTIASIISSFTNPVLNLLRDVQTVATQAIGIATAITKGVDKILNGPLQVFNQLKATILALKKAIGVISRVPRTIAQSFKQLVQAGRLSSGAAFLTSGGKSGKTKAPLLSSGRPYNPATSGTL
jgi:hypothetical protein